MKQSNVSTKQSPESTVAEIRAAILALRKERRETEQRPRTLEESLETLRTTIAATAAEYAPRSSAFTSPTPEPYLLLKPPIRPQEAEAREAYYYGEIIYAKDAANIEESLRNGPTPITTEQRQQKLKEIDARILELEREEEAAIDEAAALGLKLEHRVDVDVRAFLGLPD